MSVANSNKMVKKNFRIRAWNTSFSPVMSSIFFYYRTAVLVNLENIRKFDKKCIINVSKY